MTLSAAATELVRHAQALYLKLDTRLQGIDILRMLVDILAQRVGIAHKAVLPVAFELATMLQAHGTCDKAVIEEAEVLFTKLYAELEVRHGLTHSETVRTALTLGKIKHQRKTIHGVAKDPEAVVWAAEFVAKLSSAMSPEHSLVMGTSAAFQELIPDFKPAELKPKDDVLKGLDPDLIAWLTDGKTGEEGAEGLWDVGNDSEDDA